MQLFPLFTFLVLVAVDGTGAVPADNSAHFLLSRNGTSPNSTTSSPLTRGPKDEISCYALPYGGLGFTSHLLTYLTVFILSKGRTPLMPWRPLNGEQFKKWNIATAAINACITWPIAIVSMAKCGNTWPFILVAVWKLVFSATLTIMTAHATHIACLGTGFSNGWLSYDSDGYDDGFKTKSKEFGKIWWWSIFYFLGAFVGFVGIVTVVGQSMPGNETLVWITVGFGVAVGLVALVFACWSCPSRGAFRAGDFKGRFLASGITFSSAVTTITILFAFYSDWALAAVSGDYVGTPSKDNAVLYYFFWVAKRLPMLSL